MKKFGLFFLLVSVFAFWNSTVQGQDLSAEEIRQVCIHDDRDIDSEQPEIHVDKLKTASVEESMDIGSAILGWSEDKKYKAMFSFKIIGECSENRSLLIHQGNKIKENILIYDGESLCAGKRTKEQEEILVKERTKKANIALAKYKIMTPEYVAYCERSSSCPLRDGRFLYVDHKRGKLILADPVKKKDQPLREVKPVFEHPPPTWDSPADDFYYCPWVSGVAQSGSMVSVTIDYIAHSPDGFNKDPEVWDLKLP